MSLREITTKRVGRPRVQLHELITDGGDWTGGVCSPRHVPNCTFIVYIKKSLGFTEWEILSKAFRV